MAENSIKPRIRFKGYTDAWEQRKLGEVANIQKGQQLGKAEMSNNGAFYVLNGGMEPSGYTNQYNTFANTISISEGGNSCGYVSLNLEQFWSGGHNYTLQNPRIDTFFLYQWLKRHEKGIMALRVGSGLPNIQKSALQDVIVAYPKKSEQRAIAEILNKIDNLITLHQREHRQKKNPFLNENRSLFREAIANAWEQRKLGEIANIQKGQQLGKAEMSSTGTYYVLNGGMEASGFTNQYNTLANTISISEGGNSCGYVSLNLEHFWSGGHNYTLQNLKINTIFLYQWLKRQEKRIMALRVGSGLPNIQKSSLQDVYVKYSTTTEQQAIALFLIKIDNLITLHQRGLIKIQGDKNGKKRSFRRIVQRLF